jgi:hypothetical protein
MSTLSRKAKKAAALEKKKTERLQVVQAIEEAKRRRRARNLHIAEFAFGTLLALFLFVWTFVGPPWPTDPIFLPGSPSFGSSLDVPFSVSNKSALFSLSNLSIQCEILKLDSKGPTGAAIYAKGATFVAVSGAKNTLKPLDVGSYTCPARGIFAVDHKDAIEPDRVLAAQIAFKAGYDSRLLWGRSTSTSGIFTLNTATVPPQWTQGESLR